MPTRGHRYTAVDARLTIDGLTEYLRRLDSDGWNVISVTTLRINGEPSTFDHIILLEDKRYAN